MNPTDPGVPALSVRDLRKTYDNGVEALKGISLDVAPGDFGNGFADMAASLSRVGLAWLADPAGLAEAQQRLVRQTGELPGVCDARIAEEEAARVSGEASSS